MASNTTTENGPTAGWTHYEVLGVAEDTSAEEIKKAHRRIVRDLHPDSKSGAYRAHFDELTKGANDAADVLLDEVKRSAYDRDLAADRRTSKEGTTETRNATAGEPGARSSTGGSSSSGQNSSSNRRPGPGGSRYRRWSSAWERGRAAHERKQEQEHGPTGSGATNASSRSGYTAADPTAQSARQAYAEEQRQEQRARAVRESAKAGELGLLARAVYSIPVGAHQVGIYALCGALWAAMVYASVTVPRTFTDAPGLLPVAHIMIPMILVCILVPVLGHKLRKRWMRMSTRMFQLQPVYWPGIEPFNRPWFGRTLLEGMLFGPLWMLAATLAPGLIGQALAAVLALCALGGLIVVAGWLAVFISGADEGTMTRPGAGTDSH